jgi:ankyrin repeat protein
VDDQWEKIAALDLVLVRLKFEFNKSWWWRTWNSGQLVESQYRQFLYLIATNPYDFTANPPGRHRLTRRFGRRRLSGVMFSSAVRASQKYLNACSTGDVAKVAEFIDAGADPNSRDRYGLTVLIWTGRKGRIEAARLLLAQGAELEAADRRRRTALCHAACYTRDAYIEFLASIGANVNPLDHRFFGRSRS